MAEPELLVGLQSPVADDDRFPSGKENGDSHFQALYFSVFTILQFFLLTKIGCRKMRDSREEDDFFFFFNLLRIFIIISFSSCSWVITMSLSLSSAACFLRFLLHLLVFGLISDKNYGYRSEPMSFLTPRR